MSVTRETIFYKKKKCIPMVTVTLTYPEDLGVLGLEEVSLQLDGLLQADQKLLLEGHDLLNVPEQLLDLPGGQEGCRL